MKKNKMKHISSQQHSKYTIASYRDHKDKDYKSKGRGKMIPRVMTTNFYTNAPQSPTKRAQDLFISNHNNPMCAV
eukprot:4988007-Amphidinium_carterae.1